MTATYDLIEPTCPHCHPEHFPVAYFADAPVSADHYSTRFDPEVSRRITALYAVACDPDTSLRNQAHDCLANDDGWIVMWWRDDTGAYHYCTECRERLSRAIYYGPVRIEVDPK